MPIKSKQSKRKISKRLNKSLKGGAKKNSKTKKTKCPPNMTPIKVKNELICVGRCPHSGGPIFYNPKLDKFVCKWHGSQFNLRGKVLTPPAYSNLKVKKIK